MKSHKIEYSSAAANAFITASVLFANISIHKITGVMTRVGFGNFRQNSDMFVNTKDVMAEHRGVA